MTCGTCTMCCKTLGVDELDKPANTWCSRCSIGKGCTAYDDRPASCRDFECVWLQSQHRRHGEAAMPPELRPDRSHVVIGLTRDASNLVFVVDPNRPDAASRGAAGRLIERLRARGERPLVVSADQLVPTGLTRPDTTTAANDAPRSSPPTD